MVVILILLLARLAFAADGPLSEAVPIPQLGRNNPDGVVRGQNACSRYCDQSTGQLYRFNGAPGLFSPWVVETTGGGGGGGTTSTTLPQVICGDGVLSPTEPCDYPNIQGGCTAPSVCQNNCTCSIVIPPNPCGNGVLDGGEACDASADGSPCQTNCTAACTCNCQCNNGVIETGCSSGTNETCDFVTTTGAGGVNFGTAADFTSGRIDTNMDTTALDMAVLNDQAIWEFFLEADTLTPSSGTANQLIWKNGVATGSVGWHVFLRTNGQLALEAFAAGGGATCNSATGAIAVGNRYHVAVTRNGASVKFWVLNQSNGESVHTQSGSTCGTMITTFGNTSIEVQHGARHSDTDYFNGRLDHVRIRTCASAGTCVTDFEATAMDADWDDTVTTGPAVTAVWYLNDASIASVQEGISGTAGAGVGSVSLVDSPFDTAGTGTSTTVIGACAPPSTQTCNTASCVCQDPGTSTARTLYISSTGNDANPCTTGSPCATYQWVACGNAGCNNPNRVRSGDTIVFKDGTYPRLNVVCGNVNPSLNSNQCNGVGANTPCGTSDQLITIKSENERKALLRGSTSLSSGLGSTNALRVEGCQYVKLDGFDTVTADNTAATGSVPTIADFRNSRVTFRRILGFGNNRCGNSQVFESVGSSDNIFEENEAWNHSRHGFSCSGSTRMVYRRNYINNNGIGTSGDAACLSNGQPRGGSSRESLALYPCSFSFIENNLIEGVNGWGINVEGATWSFQGERPGSDNTIIGNVIAGTFLGMKLFTRDNAFIGIIRNLVRNNIITAKTGTGIGIRDSVTVTTTYDLNSIFENTATGQAFTADDPCTSPPCTAQLACSELNPVNTASVTITNNAVCNNSGTGIDVQACAGSATRASCTLTNNRTNSNSPNLANIASTCLGATPDNCLCSGGTTTACTGLSTTGTDCPVARPIATIGADIRCITTNGVTTIGAANSLWANAGTSTCTGTTPPGAVSVCRGGFNFCGAVVAGKNDNSAGNGDCRTYAQRRLNQNSDNTRCPSASVQCP